MKNFIRSNLFLTAAEKAALRKISRRRNVSAATVIRELLDTGLNLAASNTLHSHVAGSRSESRK